MLYSPRFIPPLSRSMHISAPTFYPLSFSLYIALLSYCPTVVPRKVCNCRCFLQYERQSGPIGQRGCHFWYSVLRTCLWDIPNCIWFISKVCVCVCVCAFFHFYSHALQYAWRMAVPPMYLPSSPTSMVHTHTHTHTHIYLSIYLSSYVYSLIDVCFFV